MNEPVSSAMSRLSAGSIQRNEDAETCKNYEVHVAGKEQGINCWKLIFSQIVYITEQEISLGKCYKEQNRDIKEEGRKEGRKEGYQGGRDIKICRSSKKETGSSKKETISIYIVPK